MSPAVLPQQPRDNLHQAGMRATRTRIAVLEALQHHPHSGADTVVKLVRTELPGTSVQGVYNILADLTGAGLLRRIEPAGSAALYERRVADNHHHLVCRRCRRIHDVDCATSTAPCLDAGQDHGFRIDEAEVTFWGMCPDCAAAGTIA